MEIETINNKTIADIASELAKGSSEIEINLSGENNRCCAEFIADKKQIPIISQAQALTGDLTKIYAHTIAFKAKKEKPEILVTVRYNGEIVYTTK